MKKIVINICGRRKKHRRRAVRGQFAGAYYVTKTGEIKVSQQHVPGATALTGQLLFKDQQGNPIAGPTGGLASSDPNVVPGLSADGQSYNVTLPAATAVDQTVALTWSDPSGKVTSFSVDFVVDAVFVPVATTGEFGPATQGTTP